MLKGVAITSKNKNAAHHTPIEWRNARNPAPEANQKTGSKTKVMVDKNAFMPRSLNDHSLRTPDIM